jgi:hypothetical protein
MSGLLTEARASLRKQLDWRGPNGRPQGILTLTREQAEAILMEGIGGMGGELRAVRYADVGGISSGVATCSGGKRIPIGKICPHCGAAPVGDECRLRLTLRP